MSDSQSEWAGLPNLNAQADGDSHGYCRDTPRRVRNCPLEACLTLGACCAGGTSALVDTSPTSPVAVGYDSAIKHAGRVGLLQPDATVGAELSPDPRIGGGYDRCASCGKVTDSIAHECVPLPPIGGGSRKDEPLLGPHVVSCDPNVKHAGRLIQDSMKLAEIGSKVSIVAQGGGSLVQMMPATSQERKNTPICTGVLDYFPLAIAAIARLSKFGNDKHNPGQPLHWSRGKSADHANCIARHLVDRGVIDPETGESHTLEVAWRSLALLQEEEEKRLGLPMSRGSR